MSYIRLSDLSPNLPMTTYEYARMKAFEGAGVDHETAKTRIYAERGSSGQPKLALGPGDQPAPVPAAVVVAAPVATAPAATTATPWWRSGLGMAALGTAGVVAGYFLSRMVRSGSSRSDSMTDITGDEVTGVLSRRNGSVTGHPHEKALRRLIDRMAHHSGRNMVVDALGGFSGSDIRAEHRAFLREIGLMGLLTGYDGKDDSVLDDPVFFGAAVRLSPAGEAERKN